MKTINENLQIAIIGMGYVGLPLAIEFGKKFAATGFDIKSDRLEKLRAGIDVTCETTPEELAAAKKLSFTGDENDLAGCDVFIVTVPTPVGRRFRWRSRSLHGDWSCRRKRQSRLPAFPPPAGCHPPDRTWHRAPDRRYR